MAIELTNIELKKCPFCGTKPTFTKDSYLNGLWHYQIVCDTCDFWLGEVGSEQTAVSKWNTQVEELKRGKEQ